MNFPGGLIIGCDAGTLNAVKIKGNHTAMKSGILAAEEVAAALMSETPATDLVGFEQRVADSWLGKELKASRNFAGYMHTFGALWDPLQCGLTKPLCGAICPLRFAIKSLITPVLSQRRHQRKSIIQSLTMC